MTPRLALLTALPWQRPAFIRAAYDPRGDYARRFADDPLAAWDGAEGYAVRVAAPLQALLEQARALGLRVVDGAVLADLQAATTHCDAVILLAHWKDAQVTREDLHASDAPSVAAALQTSAMHGFCLGPQEHPALAGQLAALAELDLDGVAKLLHRHVHATQPAPGRGTQGAFADVTHPHTWAAERRAALEAALGPLLYPGNRLELADGLHSRQAVEGAVADGFSGVLDLTICASTILASHLDRVRCGAFRIVQFTSAIDPESACLALQQALALLACGPSVDYLVARAQAVEDLQAALAGAAAPTAPVPPPSPPSPASALPWWRRLF